MAQTISLQVGKTSTSTTYTVEQRAKVLNLINQHATGIIDTAICRQGIIALVGKCPKNPGQMHKLLDGFNKLLMADNAEAIKWAQHFGWLPATPVTPVIPTPAVPATPEIPTDEDGAELGALLDEFVPPANQPY